MPFSKIDLLFGNSTIKIPKVDLTRYKVRLNK